MENNENAFDLVCVISDLGGGGTQRVLQSLIKEWVSLGKRIALITYSDESTDRYQLPPAIKRIVIGGLSESGNSISGIVSNLKRAMKLRAVLKKIESPSVLSFLSTTNILTILATMGLKYRVVIAERNDPARQSFGKMWDFLRRKTYKYADVITANSKGALQTIAEFAPPEKCKLVNNPVLHVQSVSNNVAFDAPTILSVGRLHFQKAYDVLLRAFSKFSQNNPDWQLLILGEGTLKYSLQEQAKDLGIQDRIKWMGYISDPFPYYHAAKIFAMPSRYEGMPNALLEAMSCALPVVISDALSGPLELIENNKNGVVVPVEDADALAKSLNRLAKDSNLRQILAQNAKQAVKPYLIDQVISQWEFLFE